MSTAQLLEQIFPRRRKANWLAGGQLWSRVPLETFCQAFLDGASALLAGLLSFQLRFNAPLEQLRHPFGQATLATPSSSLALLFTYALFIVLLGGRSGLYAVSRKTGILREIGLTFQTVAAAGLLLCGTLFATREYVISRIVVASTVVLSFVILATRRSLASYLAQRRCMRGLDVRNVLIVGDDRVAHALRHHFEALRHQGFRFKGFISTTATTGAASGSAVIGSLEDCVSLARSLFVDEIYFSAPSDREDVLRVVEQARAVGIEVFAIPELYNGLAWNADVEYVGQFPALRLHRRATNRGRLALKRALDVGIASFILLLTSPLLLVLAVLVRLDSDGASVYKAERVGRKGRVFRCYKFRTMVANADYLRGKLAHMNERKDILFKIQNDPRITRVGAFLRKYSLDELPQLFNVLKGDMSLVGPRPPLVSEVDQYALSHLRRLDVLPGITGLWQVYARQDPSFESYITLDTTYIENWSLMMDLRIMLRTASVIVGGTGA